MPLMQDADSSIPAYIAPMNIYKLLVKASLCCSGSDFQLSYSLTYWFHFVLLVSRDPPGREVCGRKPIRINDTQEHNVYFSAFARLAV